MVNPHETELDEGARDLGPLAWVLEELRKSLDGATRALRRFARDAELARGSDIESLDTSQLRGARQQLHQAVGALEMVDLPAPAGIVRLMESAAHRFIAHPELCDEAAVQRLDRASFALTEYLEGSLKGRLVSCVALFVPYREVAELAGAERIHPADLWSLPVSLAGMTLSLPVDIAPLTWSADLRSRIDVGMLRVMQGSQDAAAVMRDCALGLGAATPGTGLRNFWVVAAGFFDALAAQRCPLDVYSKRAVSALLLQARILARGDDRLPERLLQDLLFFCAQAGSTGGHAAAVLDAVRQQCGLHAYVPVDYQESRFGRFDPAQLTQARKRIAAAAESWSALSGGDTNRLRLVGEHFALVAESLLKLHPQCRELAQSLNAAIEGVVRSGEAPGPALGIEVATAVLYLEAVYEDMDPFDTQMAQRSGVLAQRLQQVAAGAPSAPLDTWMEDLYGRVSDRQTMGSVVGELRTNLGGIEKSLDAFFRQPTDTTPLREVPNQLAQMRGVFSVLGLDQAALACVRMRDQVEALLVGVDAQDAAVRAGFERLGNSLGSLGFLIDMLSYQRALAKQLFAYDEQAGEFRSLLRREPSGARPSTEPATTVTGLPSPGVPLAPPSVEPGAAAQPLPGAVAPSAPLAPAAVQVAVVEQDDDEQELREIFLEEAREVIQNGLAATQGLGAMPGDVAQQTTLRRAFHTLKGSARMVHLTEFGEAAWAMEQMLNAWLAEQKPVDETLLTTAERGLKGFALWIQAITEGQSEPWSALPFRTAADAQRLRGEMAALTLPGDTVSAAAAPGAVPAPVSSEPEVGVRADLAPHTGVPDFDATQIGDFAGTEVSDFAPTQMAADEPSAATPEPTVPDQPLLGVELDFSGLTQEAPAAESVMPAQPPVPVEPQEALKIIGDLEIPIPLYNVYLNEADEWSRRLATELSEWSMESRLPLSDTAVALAHSLAGSSATVGFRALSAVARALEHALVHGQAHPLRQHVSLLLQAAEDIRWLLHQFAAGFLREPEPTLVQRLQALLESDGSEEPTTRPPLVDVEAVLSDAVEAADAVVAQPTPHVPAAPVAVSPVDREQVPEDVLDVDLFPIFEEEAQELLPQLAGALRQWTVRVDNLSARQEVLRVLHTLKGSARLAGARGLGDMAHRMESTIESLGDEGLSSEQAADLLARFDAINQCFERLRQVPEPERSHPESPADGAAAVAAPSLETAPEPLLQVTEPAVTAQVQDRGWGTHRPAMPALAPVARPLQTATVRVRAPLLDTLVNQAGEVLITRSRLEARLGQLRGSLAELSGNLDRLRHQLREMEVQSESQMQSRLAQARDSAQGFDPLEFDRFTRVQELTRMMAESVHDVATVQRNLQRSVEGVEDDLVAQARQTRELQRDLLRTRMVEFDSIAERLHGVVRLAAKEAGRQAQLVVQGGALEIDRGVLERVTPAFEHLLRNAVGHGIEAPEQRRAAGKDETGTITIRLQQQANDVAVEFSDDGAGLDLQRIRDKALATGRLAPGQTVDDALAAQLIFAPGLSTATVVTALAGRGIGLDVVRNEVNALGGRVETRTTAGQGTAFRLILPLTTAVTQVVMLRLGDATIGVPANLVELVRRVPVTELEQAYRSQSIAYADEAVPLFWAGALLQLSDASAEWRARTLPVAIFRSAGQRVALHVDEVLGNQEVVVKNLGPQLSRLPALTGMSVLASGAVVLIYNPVALATVFGDAVRKRVAQSAWVDSPASGLQVGEAASGAATATAQVATADATPLVLVVDDSITVRRVTQRLLKREGFRVALANDGLQALEQLQGEMPAVVLSDIEMPRMDGFDLARNIRADARLRHLPIIMITSRIAEKHREHARELGVNHYLGKPYSEDELIGLVRRYAMATAEVAAS